MGLDMYLYKHTYVQNWDHMSPERLHEITIKRNGKIREDIKPERIAYIVEVVGTWRKFNALHNWFVKECQGGVDECQTSRVPREKLELLLFNLKQIQANHDLAETYLPTVNGFFFGGTEYSEWYFNDVDRTIVILEDILKDKESEYYYHSSW